MRKVFKYLTIYSLILIPLTFFQIQETKANQYLPQKLVKTIDLKRFAGTWYEISRFPNFFQSKDAIGGTDTYRIEKNGQLKVTYRWYDKTFQSEPKSMQGNMWIDDPEIMGKMKVQFFWPFAADYWLLDRDKGYNYLVVGYPDRSLLWILSKKPVMNENTYQRVLKQLKKQSYDISKLVKVKQKTLP